MQQQQQQQHQPMIELSYTKPDNRTLFTSLANVLNVQNSQNYVPLYERFFNLTSNSATQINLNQHYLIKEVLSKVTDNIYVATICKNKKEKEKEKSNNEKVKIFFKYSPLLDPIKYLLGKYDINDVNLMNLPTYAPEATATVATATIATATIATATCHPKTQDKNNMAFVDSFFTYLISQLRHQHGFLHGVDFYGSYLGIKHDFAVNIYDDLEYLQESNFFLNNKDILYQIDEEEAGDMLDLNYYSRKNKVKLNLQDTADDAIILNLSDISDIEEIEMLFTPAASATAIDAIDAMDVVYDVINNNNSSSTKKSLNSTNCSSRTSNTNTEGDDDTEGESESDDDTDAVGAEDAEGAESEEDADTEGADTEGAEDDVEGELFAKIKTFPVQVIALECCENTLDDLIMQHYDDITDAEWSSIIIQILMSLITFQKCFDLTHNDLHTNNIMYSATEEKFLFYKFNEKYYKVPTFGRIYKIIDFGRAIYKFRGQLLYSDSYNAEGDAYTQYNSEPFFNLDKPRVDPNPSFDLCRLGCALFDFIVDDLRDVEKIAQKSPIKKIMLDWCKMDNGKNIMYKKNGDERYPEFKLYKMIARTVHGHNPQNVLNNDCFHKFVVKRKAVNKDTSVMDIDAMPSYI